MTVDPSDTPRHVLVTGATGFIAKHIVLDLLEAGHRVRGSMRNTRKAEAMRETLRQHLRDPQALDRLDFVALDLEKDAGWDAALDGVDVLMHTASPFPITQPKDEMDAIRPAVEGTRRALEAVARNGVQRVILTSSVVAVSVQDRPKGARTFSEADWSDTEARAATAYAKSKTLAERTAWEIAEEHDLHLTTINPALVLGPPLDGAYGSSIGVIERAMKKSDPMLPQFGFSVVDVRDVAAMHVAAMEREASIGRRMIAAAEFMWFSGVVEVLDAAFPERKLRRPLAPDALLRVLALFDRSLQGIVPMLGREDRFDASPARDVLGVTFRDAPTAVRAAGERLVALGKV